jgi:murein DD-endopeptidase MepM/ murein hydrolase activator NlpD
MKTETAAHTRRGLGGWIAFAAAMGFLAGMLVMAAIVTMFPSGAAAVTAPIVRAAGPAIDVKPTRPEEPAPVAPPPAPPPSPTPVMSANSLEDLRLRSLTLPVQGIKREQLHSNFADLRGGTRQHEALDILAPRNTPVLAVEDGTIAKLFLSDAGGITIYQYDPSMNYVYYYAHLERYASGLKEGQAVKRGDVIGYVGTTGNAPRDTPHLHFAIFKMTGDKKWWQGAAIDPYSVLK